MQIQRSRNLIVHKIFVRGESTKGEAPALLKSVGKSPMISAKPVLYRRLSHDQHSYLASLAMQGKNYITERDS